MTSIGRYVTSPFERDLAALMNALGREDRKAHAERTLVIRFENPTTFASRLALANIERPERFLATLVLTAMFQNAVRDMPGPRARRYREAETVLLQVRHNGNEEKATALLSLERWWTPTRLRAFTGAARAYLTRWQEGFDAIVGPYEGHQVVVQVRSEIHDAGGKGTEALRSVLENHLRDLDEA